MRIPQVDISERQYQSMGIMQIGCSGANGKGMAASGGGPRPSVPGPNRRERPAEGGIETEPTTTFERPVAPAGQDTKVRDLPLQFLRS